MFRDEDVRSRPLRIGLNLVFLGGRAGGIGRYATELAGALLEAEPDSELHVFVSRDAPAELRGAPWAGNVRWVVLPVRLAGPPVHLLAQFAALPPLALARRLDVLHSPANTGPAIVPGLSSVISLHDLIWLHRAAEWEPSTSVQRRMDVLVRHCVRHADRVFADSHAAAEDFVATLGLGRERIDVTPLGVRAPVAGPSIPEAELRGRLGLGDSRVVLCVAQKRPYKNLGALLHALVDLDDDVMLVLPGAPTAHERELRTIADGLGVSARVRFLDWISDEELDGLYALSRVFVLPSLIEGFGLPVLEAMARGVPVACANVAALPEVAGDAALLFDPQRQQEVTAALRGVLDDPALAEALVARGHERVAAFTWRRTGEASLAGYRRAMLARGRRLSPAPPA
jgi:glycosyltransferase involved in cell wall biosynthesis